ncbi:MAG: HAD family phosphatase, partial [Vallitaleaceae bacterium]|nr:HAD family phosphatase [Vallitaleaceae bacterium]
MKSSDKKEYRLVCMDLDGTLLDENHRINDFTLEVLREVEKKGVILAISTGRDGFDAKHHASYISKNSYFIGANGTVVGKVGQSELIAENPMDSKLAARLLLYAKENRIKTVISTTDRMIMYGL